VTIVAAFGSSDRGPNEGTTRRESTMNAIQALKKDHETAKRGFSQIQAAAPNQRGALWEKLEPELKLHEQVEEKAVYGPVAQDAGAKDRKLKEWPEQHKKEVSEAEALIKAINGLDATSDQWMAKVSDLHQALEHHIKEEEGEVWPRIEQAWNASKLEKAGEEIESLKRQKTPRAA
jgi:hypothetical protein